MTTPLTLTRPAKIHCLARVFGVSGCFRSNQSNKGAVFVSIISRRLYLLFRWNGIGSPHDPGSFPNGSRTFESLSQSRACGPLPTVRLCSEIAEAAPGFLPGDADYASGAGPP